MPQPAADRNLLFGILAMQMDFITREQLLTAMQAWVFDKSKSLGEILQAHKALAEDNRALLEALVRKHLAHHDNDPEKSLASLSSAGNLRTDLEKISDPDVQASLIHVSVKTDVDPYATVMPTGRGTGHREQPTTGMRFRVVRPHAKGGLGEVFIARDEELNREVALKEIQDRAADDQDSRMRFMLEAEITGGLEHPGIVPVYGLGTYADGRPYYAMRFIRGDSLKDAIEKFHRAPPGTLSEGDRSLILRSLLGRLIDVCNAMAYAHARGILHRDLKPGNVMLGKYGETLVVDWGLAKPLGELSRATMIADPGEGSLIPSSYGSGSQTMAGSAVGTPHYMSPEQAAGRLDQLGPASDVYSLGATLFCILTGKSPVSESDVGTVLRKVQQGDFPRPRAIKGDVSPALEAICLKAMALKPTERYPSPKELADDLEHWLADEPVTAWQEPVTVRARRWIGRHAVLVTGAVSAIVVALVGLVVATVLLTAANERERTAKERERLAKEKAEENYQLARKAVDRYHTDVSEQLLLHEPGMAPLRKNLLAAASEFYQKFLKEREGDPAVQGEFARATFRLAQITGDIGDKTDAVKMHEKAAKLLEALPEDKATTQYKIDLAACYHHQGRLQRADQRVAAEAAYVKAIAAWEQLLKADAKSVPIQVGLARSQFGLGNLYQDNKRKAEAEKIYLTALEGCQAVAEADPKAAQHQRELATNQHNLGRLYAQMGKDAAKYYKDAIKIQQQLVDDHPHVSQYHDDLARTHFNLGDLRMKTGGDPLPDLTQAVHIWKAQMERHPAHAAFQRDLADAYSKLATAYRPTDPKKAEETATHAVPLARRLVAAHADPEFKGCLARALFVQANVRNDRRLPKEPEAAYREAINLLEKLQDVSLTYRALYGSAYNQLGLLYTDDHNNDKARDAFLQAKTVYQKLSTDHSGDDEYTIALANVLCNLGGTAQYANKHDDAHPFYTQALACLDLGKLKTPDSPAVQQMLYLAHWKRAESLTALKQHTGALGDWTRTAELAPKKVRPIFQLQRATTLSRMGRHQDAVKELDVLAPIFAGDARGSFMCACAYSLAFAAVEADKECPAAERKKLTDEYVGASVKALSKARALGYFKSPEDRQKLENEPDLAALRGRPEFKKLLSEIETESK